ncbi:hypothetical protein QAD02_010844 [Eretmocerus hayati]|uniref:Uncharacterized protein n=1 Tax=Eretmocerus hayati TaxID=131215 RepID=A0ACC2NW12_9HYME|nr:hypothetical protein QAD02_010844 [Eretmocerus hayati]
MSVIMNLTNLCVLLCLAVTCQAGKLMTRGRSDVPPSRDSSFEDLVPEESGLSVFTLPNTEALIPVTEEVSIPTTVSQSNGGQDGENSNATELVTQEPKEEAECDTCEILKKIKEMQQKQETYHTEVLEKIHELKREQELNMVEIIKELKKLPRAPVTSRPYVPVTTIPTPPRRRPQQRPSRPCRSCSYYNECVSPCSQSPDLMDLLFGR